MQIHIKMCYSRAFPERYNFFNLIIKIINGNDSDIGSTFNVPITIKTLDYRVKRAPFKILNDSLTLYYVCVANRSNSTILYSFQFQTSILDRRVQVTLEREEWSVLYTDQQWRFDLLLNKTLHIIQHVIFLSCYIGIHKNVVTIGKCIALI